MKRYDTDVLIVGGGGAATAATISAHQSGARTVMAVKGRFGVPGARGAGATSNPIADFWTIRTVGPKGGFFNPPDAVYKDMLQTGLGMADPDLCRIFVDEVSEAAELLQSVEVIAGAFKVAGQLDLRESARGRQHLQNRFQGSQEHRIIG